MTKHHTIEAQENPDLREAFRRLNETAYAAEKLARGHRLHGTVRQMAATSDDLIEGI